MIRTLDVVIVNWNSGQQLRCCLASLARTVREGFQFGRVVVVDNASTDGSADDLPGYGLPLATVRNDTNRGFAAAVNQAARQSTADLLLLLNPDMLLRKDSLAVPIAFLEKPEHTGVAVVGLQLVGQDGEVQRTCARLPTAAALLRHSLGLHRSPFLRDYVMAEWDHGQTREVDHVIGAFYLLRRAVFAALGGLDERFFLYLEDLDFSARAKAAGWRIVFLSGARAYHKGGGSSESIKVRRLSYSLESRIRYAYKHYNPAAATLVLAATLFLEPFPRLLLALAHFSQRDTLDLFYGYAMLWSSLTRAAYAWVREWSARAKPPLVGGRRGKVQPEMPNQEHQG